MGMYRPTRERLAALVDQIGTQVTTDQIRGLEEEGVISRGTLNAVRSYGEQLSRKEFDLSNVLSEISEELTVNPSASKETSSDEVEDEPQAEAAMHVAVDNTEKTPVKSSAKTDSLDEIPVPARDPLFVSDPQGSFPVLNKVLKSDVFAPVYITGLSGNGKTFSVEQACARNNRPLVIFNVTNETTEEDLIGHYTLQDGNLVWRDGPVIAAYRAGAVLCLDEIDQGTSRLMCLQTILQRKPYFIKKTNETVYPADGFAVIATGNTKGTGDETDRFIGAQIMNEAFLERFPITVHQPYPNATVERRILGKIIKDDSEMADRLVAWSQQSRRDEEDGVVDAITTRRLVQIAVMIPIFGDVTESIRYATNRFGEDSRDGLIKAFELLTMDSESVASYNSGGDGDDSDDDEHETDF